MPPVTTFSSRYVCAVFVAIVIIFHLHPGVCDDRSANQARSSSLPELPLELLPYRVQLLVAFDAPSQSANSLSRIIEDSRRMVDRCLGSFWRMSANEIDWLLPVTPDALMRLKLANIVDRVPVEQEPIDVWFLATIRENGSNWIVDMRAWQPDVRLESDVAQRRVNDIRDLPLVLVQLCHQLFRPVGRVEDVEGKTARIVLQGAALAVPDDTFSLAQTVKALIPVMVYRNRERKVERLQAIPWTYLTVSDSTQSRWMCEIQSGLRSPIGGKQRGRISTMAIAVQSIVPATRLELATQAKLSLPLIAHRIEVRDSPEIPRQDEVTEPDEHLIKTLLTDRRGLVNISAHPDSTVVWLFAYRGKHLLARVPFLPGSLATVRLEVPDDGPRLEAESDLHVLQGQLIESVAATNTTYARIRAKLKKNGLSDNDAEEKEIRALPKASVYLERVIAVRVPAVKAAKARKDRAGEARINRMCDEMSDLIRQYLNEDKREQLLEELKELRRDNLADKMEESR